jgi:glycosyltransferase involved in cell wall biosynthesis
LTRQPPASPLVVQVTLFYPPHLGGVERVAQTLAELLSEHRDVLVLTTTCGAEGAPRAERSGRLTVRRARGVEAAHTPISPGLALELLRLPRDAVVHAHLGQAFLPEITWLTSRLRRRRYILHFHLDVDQSGRMGRVLPAYNRFVLGPVLRRAAGVIVLSEEQASFIAEEYRVERGRITVIPNGVPPAFFLERPSEPDAGDGPLRLLSVGRISVQKNVPRLLEAMARVDAPVELVLVGDGDERPRVEQLIEQLGLTNVRLVGAAHGAALLEWYRWGQAFVLSSDKEGLPLALLEAMAAGLPIVATDVPGTHEMLTGYGILTGLEPAELAAGITRLAEDPALRAELAERGRAHAEANSWRDRAADVERTYGLVGAG